MRSIRNGIYFLKKCEGKGALGCLLFLVLLGVMAMFAVQAGPPYFAYRGLEGDVKTEVSRAGAHLYSNDVLVENILDLAKKNEIRLKKEDIRVERFAGQIQVVIHYALPVNFIVFAHTFDFDIKASSFIGRL
jgi:hypothetical protein